MPPSTILSSVRQPLATALAGVAGNVYSFVPESVIPPAATKILAASLINFSLSRSVSIFFLFVFDDTPSRMP